MYLLILLNLLGSFNEHHVIVFFAYFVSSTKQTGAWKLWFLPYNFCVTVTRPVQFRMMHGGMALNTHAQVLRHEVPDMTMIGICRTCSVYARNYQYSLLITSWCQLWSSHTQCQNGYNKACPSSLPCSNYLVQKFRPNLSCQFNPFSGNLSDDCRLRHDDHHLVAKCLFYPTNM